MRGEHSVSINMPAAAIFSVIADGNRNPEWRRSVIEVALSSGDGGLGTVWHQVVRGPAEKPADADYRVTSHEPARAYGVELISGPVRGHGLYTLAPGDDGETKVTLELTLTPRGALRMLSGFVLRQLVDELDSLDSLRQMLERARGGTG